MANDNDTYTRLLKHLIASIESGEKVVESFNIHVFECETTKPDAEWRTYETTGRGEFNIVIWDKDKAPEGVE